MPTKRTVRRRHIKPAISEAALAAMFDKEPPAGANPFELNELSYPEGHEWCRKLWDEFGESVVKEWVQDHPGTRPSWWWAFDAPEPVGGSALVATRSASSRTSPPMPMGTAVELGSQKAWKLIHRIRRSMNLRPRTSGAMSCSYPAKNNGSRMRISKPENLTSGWRRTGPVP